ncbi:MAG: hypothetical protein KDA45_01975 [Planctomycetales bacterium]|nr:hypothetical protein [Planctomycetales bacterium]
MWWIILLVALGLILAVHCLRGLSVRDRVDVALDIVRSSRFSVAEGFDRAVQEDPELMGWLQAGKDCVMLFRSTQGEEVREIVDVASGSFHPGLVIHYLNGKAMRAGKIELREGRVKRHAEQLLRDVRRAIQVSQGEHEFGCRY